MQQLILLISLLKNTFSLNLARAKCAAGIIIGFIKTRTVNLTELATALPGEAKLESRYKRLQRFFKEVKFDFTLVARFIVNQLPDGPLKLTIDRTNWKIGAIDINIFYLGAVYQGVAFPILWTLLPKKGNSNTKERIVLINRFIAIFGVDKIDFIAADREFIGREFIRYLIDLKSKFRIRIKHNTRIGKRRGGTAQARNFFRNASLNCPIQLKGKRSIWGHKLYITGMRLADDYLIIIHHDENESAVILEDYSERWQIETLFKCLKSGGFNLEDTHLTHQERLETLISLLAITFAWAHVVGEWRHTHHPIIIKSHQRRAKSIFRYGLDWLRDVLLNSVEKLSAFHEALVLFLSRTQAYNLLI